MLCYNRLLVPYLRSLVKGYPTISVDTFGKFTHGHGLRVSLADEASSAVDVERALTKAFPVVDALLVDEWQDFFPSWTALLSGMLFPGRGGIVLAGDPKQALYRDGDLDRGLQGRRVIHEELTTPYRSTRQILEITSYLDPALSVSGREGALEGEPVDLVSAESHREQAAAVARDIRWLLDDGVRSPENIGVLYTRRFQLGAIARALEAAGVPFEVGSANEGAEFNLATPRVKVITVHSAKGYEFDVVFLVGLELLPDPDGSPEAERQGRTGYVGATRARDQLVITYSKPNSYLDRLRSAPEELLRRWMWPEDYAEVQ
jgi:superfamily I DNA/RNA helicase